MTNVWILTLAALAILESSGNPSEINTNEQAYGVFQIRQVKLDAINEHTGLDLQLTDFLDRPDLMEWAFMYSGAMHDCKSPEEYVRYWHRPSAPYDDNSNAYWKRFLAVVYLLVRAGEVQWVTDVGSNSGS
jgi:hypothetical protein